MKKSKILIILSALLILFVVIQINKNNYTHQRFKALEIINDSRLAELYFLKEFPLKEKYSKYKKPLIINHWYQLQEGYEIYEGWFFGDINPKPQFNLRTTFLMNGDLEFDETTLYKYVNIETMEKVKVKGVEGAYSSFLISTIVSNPQKYIYSEDLYFVLEGVEYSVSLMHVNEEPFGSDFLVEIINNNLIKKD